MFRPFARDEGKFYFREVFLKHRPELLVDRIMGSVNNDCAFLLRGLNGGLPLSLQIGLRFGDSR